MTNDLIAKIRTRGYWEVTIRPITHQPNRITPISKLFPLVQKNAVQIRGWDFPHIDTHHAPAIGQDWISQPSEWQHNKEVWRFYQSGQFICLRGIAHDWRDESQWWPPKANEEWKPGAKLGMLDAFFSLVEFYEFAARLSNSEAGESEMKIEVVISGLRGRELEMDSLNRVPSFSNHPATLDKFQIPTVTILRDRLLADPVAPAVDATVELFARFNKDISPSIIRDWLSDLRR